MQPRVCGGTRSESRSDTYALEKARFAVAHVHALCTDDEVIGTWFYVMDMIEGRIFWNATVPGVSIADRHATYDAMNATMAQLHMIRSLMSALVDLIPIFSATGRLVKSVFRGENGHEEVEIYGRADH